MVDCAEHLDLIERCSGVGRGARSGSRSTSTPAGGRWAAGSRSGPKRSPVQHRREAARSWPREIERRPRLELVGLMAYEGQIAGVGDAAPGQPPAQRRDPRDAAALDARRCAERRAAIVAAVREVAELEFVNGGGTGSLELTAAEPAVTELAAGSGFYAPALFDHYRSLHAAPRRRLRAAGRPPPAPAVATALGGGYLASGAATRTACPSPGCPPASARPDGGRGRGADAAARRRGAGAAGRRPRLHAPREGRRAVRALRLALSGRGRRRSSTRCRPTAARARRSSSARSHGPEHPVGVVVARTALGVEAVADGLEVLPARIALRERRGGLEVALAPVRAALVVVHDLLDRLEVGLPLHAAVLVHGDVGGRRARCEGLSSASSGATKRTLDRERDLDAPRRAISSRTRRTASRARARAGSRTPSR